MLSILKFTLKLLAGLILFSLVWVTAYRWIDPPTTSLMIRDHFNDVKVYREWVGLNEMSRHIPRAVIAAEDARFCEHNGFDVQAIEKAMQANEQGKKLRGGSTISQQTAKNAFLWSGRTWVRKGLEAWFTVLIEFIWGKPRIMEVYLNIAEFGRGVFGVQAASIHYFNKPASKLTRTEAARLAAILPQPIKRDAASPGRYTKRYANRIAGRTRVVANEGLDACVWK
ncbi:monofunctional biosynthetic peptidoglycan transglycosylase [Sandaracinobacter neustonicus]|uniref:Biosynthetic peptidoglycan transglycosylase n=1 Tax=Sandaracinobacter neustonicus TaxID=1715348 RepID=A0A501XEC6_9SPHN|nr:monofunctional biosynthetic peptidoglycan transglycosylase [Sandaracinobacter neustonicus]TPE58653.1 monofunctional biosynthetic peptidoglycan transglycosylase [Sandaracinobacter neustonicus]